jgi:hypothetical protein
VLDGQEQVGCSLHFVNDQQAVVPDEQARISLGRRPDRGFVEIAELGSAEGARDGPRERALAEHAVVVLPNTSR